MPVKFLTTPVPAIPVGVPSQLLQRRPDIAAAERTMAQANALIGVEKAAYYPTLSLTGSGGLQSSAIAKLFSLPALFWSLGASASETIFDAGLRKATVAQYTATYNADVAAYKQTVLTAFQQVEDYIATLRVLSSRSPARCGGAGGATIPRHRHGAVPDRSRSLPRRDHRADTLLSDQQTLVTLRVSEMTAAVQLIQALGGGWERHAASRGIAGYVDSSRGLMYIEDRGARYSHGRREASVIREGTARRECYDAVALDSARVVIEGTNAGTGLMYLHDCRSGHGYRRGNTRVIREGAASHSTVLSAWISPAW
jgi:hypothetical protein